MTSDKPLHSLDDLYMTPQEKKLAALSPATADKIFIFIKEKQEKIANATTVGELDTLKKEMKEEKKDTSSESENTNSKTVNIVE